MSRSFFVLIWTISWLQVREFFVTESTYSWFLGIKLVIPSVLICYCRLVENLIVLPLEFFLNALVHSVIPWDFRALWINRLSQIGVPQLVNYLHVVRNFLLFFLIDLHVRFLLDMKLILIFIYAHSWCLHFRWITHHQRFFFLNVLNHLISFG